MAIQADYTTLQKQAPMTAEDYLRGAVAAIDKQFEDGYAKKHPELVAAFMQVCAKDMGTATLVIAIQEAAQKLAQALESA